MAKWHAPLIRNACQYGIGASTQLRPSRNVSSHVSSRVAWPAAASRARGAEGERGLTADGDAGGGRSRRPNWMGC
jgi:hypothetical protein